MKIIVSLVVILAVGTTIITISTDLLYNSKDNIDNIGKIESEDKMIEKDSFSENEIQALAQQCFDNNYGIRKENLCYILKANNNIDIISMSFNPPITSTIGKSKTIYIKYDINSNITITD